MSLIDRLNQLDGLEPDEIVRRLNKPNIFAEMYGATDAFEQFNNVIRQVNWREVYVPYHSAPSVTHRYVGRGEPRPHSALPAHVWPDWREGIPSPLPED